MRMRPVGADGLLLEVDDPASWFEELWRCRTDGRLSAVEIVPGARTVLLDGLTDPGAAADLVRSLTPPATVHSEHGPVEIPVSYDGPDLAAVAAHWGVAESDVIDRLGSTEFRVAFCGFVPGFGYLTGLPEELSV